MEKWIYNEEQKCIRCNDIPILEGSYHNDDCKNALLLAQKAPEMLEMLKALTNMITFLDRSRLPISVNRRIDKRIFLAKELIKQI